MLENSFSIEFLPQLEICLSYSKGQIYLSPLLGWQFPDKMIG